MALLQSRMKCTAFCLVILTVVTRYREVSCNVLRNRSDLSFWEPVPPPQSSYIPEKPKKVTCVLDNYESADCDWCPDEEPQEMTIWKFEFVFAAHQNWTNCPVYRNKGKFGRCICHLCGFGDEMDQACEDRVDFIRNRKYTIRIQAVSGTSVVISDNFTVQFSPKLAKPKPVRDLSTSVRAKDAIDVSWKYPLRLEPDYFPLNYFISYQSMGTPTPSTDHTVKVVKTSNLNYTLTELRPFMEYNISVQCSPPDGNYYSDKKFSNNITLQGAPSKPVQVKPGGFQVNDLSCDGKPCRNVKLFWKNIEEAHRNGIIVNYTLSYTSSSEGSQHRVFFPPSPGSLLHSAILASLNMEEAYSVSIVSSTVAGASPPANVFIDSKSKMPPYPDNIEMEYFEKKNGLTVSWTSPPGGATGFTLHYCYFGQSNQGCAGDLFNHFIKAAENHTDYIVDIVIDKADNNVYGLSTERGASSSGMNPVWQCVYEYYGVVGTPEFDIPVSGQQERSLKVVWQKMKCSQENRGRVVRYYLFWCRAGNCGNYTEVTISYTETEYIIRDLEPFTSYTVRMAADSRAGRGAVTTMDKSKTSRTVESKPDDLPFNFTIKEVTGSNISCSWQTSLIPNGRIIRHEVYVKDLNRDTEETKHVFSGSVSMVTIKNLIGYTNYSLQVASCNNAGCSERSDVQITQTKIRAPSQMTHVEVKINDDDRTKRDKAMVRWSKPNPTNGPISFYQIQISGDYKKSVDVKSSSTSDVIEVECERSNINVSFSVLAVTEDERKKLHYGIPSEQRYIDMCNVDFPHTLVITITSILVAVAVVIALSIFCCRYFRRREPITVPDRPQKIPVTEGADADQEYFGELHSPTSADLMLLPQDDPDESTVEEVISSRSSSNLCHQGRSSVNGDAAEGQRSLSGTVISGLFANEAGAVCNGDIRGAFQPDPHNGVSGQPADLSGQPGQHAEDAAASGQDSVDSYCRVAVEGNATLSPDYIVVDAEVLTSGGSVVSSVADYSRLAAQAPLPPSHPQAAPAAGNDHNNQNNAGSGQVETSGESLGYSRFTVNPAAQPGDVHDQIEMNVMSHAMDARQGGAVTVGCVHMPQSHPVIPGNINFDESLTESCPQKQSQSRGPCKRKVDYTPLSKISCQKMSSPHGSCSGGSLHSISSMDYDEDSATIMPVEKSSEELPITKCVSGNGTGHSSGLGSSEVNTESSSKTNANTNSGHSGKSSASIDSGHSSTGQRSARSFLCMIEPSGMAFSRNVNNNNNENCAIGDVITTENEYVSHPVPT